MLTPNSNYKTRILVTGASGMLGATLSHELAYKYDIFATGNSDFKDSAINYKKFNLVSDNYTELVEWARPDIVILSGALTDGKYCDDNPSQAFSVNGLSVRKFIDSTNKNVKFIYISTDAVFPSSLHLAKESDPVFPESVYGKSKELGEFFLLNSERDFTIIRTTIVGLNLNKNKQSFVEWIINSIKNDQEINLFKDVIFNPISIWDLSKEISYIINNELFNNDILHIAGDEICTKHEFGYALLTKLGLSTKKVNEGSIFKFKDRAKRCSDQTLNTDFYQEVYKRKLPSLETTFEIIRKNYDKLN